MQSSNSQRSVLVSGASVALICFCSILLLCLSSCSCSDLQTPSSGAELDLNEVPTLDVAKLNLKETLEHLYGEHQPGRSALMPDTTLNLLRHLEGIYNQVGNEFKRSEVASLIELSQLPINCGRELFSELNSLIKTYSTWDSKIKTRASYGNLLSYLEYSRKRLFFHCEQSLGSQIKYFIDQEISIDDRNNVALLKKKVFALNPGYNPQRPYFYIPKHKLEEGILSYMEQKFNGKFNPIIVEDKRLGVYYFEEDFTRLVTKVCKSVRKVLEPIVEIYDLFIEEPGMSKIFDQVTFEWIVNTRLCRDILLDLETVRSGSFQLLLSRPEKPKKKPNPLWKVAKHLSTCFQCYYD